MRLYVDDWSIFVSESYHYPIENQLFATDEKNHRCIILKNSADTRSINIGSNFAQRDIKCVIINLQ